MTRQRVADRRRRHREVMELACELRVALSVAEAELDRRKAEARWHETLARFAQADRHRHPANHPEHHNPPPPEPENPAFWWKQY